MGLLDGDIANLFGSVMGSFYLPATLRKVTLVSDGQGGGTSVTTTHAVKVQEDVISEQTRAAGGWSQLDKMFIILQAGVSVVVDGDCQLTVSGITYALSLPTQDPAKSYWMARGVPV